MLQDSDSLQSALADAELSCIGDSPEELAFALTGPGPESGEEQARLLNCLHDETLARLFVAGFVPGPEPLSLGASECVRAAFDVIDPKAVMTAGIEGNPGMAMAGSMVALTITMACLTREEWEEASDHLAVGPEDGAAMRCVMEALGGPGQLAGAVMATQEVHFTTYNTPEEALTAAKESAAILDAAAEACEMKMAQGPATLTPTPTATMEALSPTPVPTTPGPTPAPMTASTPPTPVSTPATTLVITVAEIPAGIPDYDRKDWKHWVDADGDCQDARQEVLVVESLEPVTYEDDRQCRVEAGKWWAPYLGHHLGNLGHIDVDHHVPLKNAHLSGGWRWDEARKREYANYLEDPDHLIAISSRHNRSKGARGPEEWAPPDEGLW